MAQNNNLYAILLIINSEPIIKIKSKLNNSFTKLHIFSGFVYSDGSEYIYEYKYEDFISQIPESIKKIRFNIDNDVQKIISINLLPLHIENLFFERCLISNSKIFIDFTNLPTELKKLKIRKFTSVRSDRYAGDNFVITTKEHLPIDHKYFKFEQNIKLPFGCKFSTIFYGQSPPTGKIKKTYDDINNIIVVFKNMSGDSYSTLQKLPIP